MNRLKDILYYSSRERNAFLMMIFLLVITQLAILLMDKKPVQANAEQLKIWQESVASFEKSLSVLSPLKEKRAGRLPLQKQSSRLKPRYFDPNKISAKELESMGLSSYVVNNIVHYRQKGGRFRKVSDLSKIYGMKSADFDALVPYVQFEQQVKDLLDTFSHKALNCFDFDPNRLSADSFLVMGLSEKVTQRILNYRQKGGQFRTKEDFERMYDLSPSVYLQLEAYIRIQPRWNNKSNRMEKSYQLIEVNSASIEQWQQFKGIGPSFAKRIIKYKEALGGFVDVRQIGEVFLLPDSVYRHMHPHLHCKPILPAQININEASIETLKAHPYLRWFHAKAILKYRETKGDWPSVDLLQILPEFDDNKNTFERVSVYLRVLD